MIKISGDVELNPGPDQKQDQSLSICHWNLNSIPAHNFQKFELLQGFISIWQFMPLWDFFDSNISCNDDNLQIPGFNLIRAEHSFNTKREVAYIHY